MQFSLSGSPGESSFRRASAMHMRDLVMGGICLSVCPSQPDTISRQMNHIA